MATGDTPSRPQFGATLASLNGGLGNLPHFIENWRLLVGNNKRATNISGSFIQLKRSEYATAPWWNLLDNSGTTGGPFGHIQRYKTQVSDGKIRTLTRPQGVGVLMLGYFLNHLTYSLDNLPLPLAMILMSFSGK